MQLVLIGLALMCISLQLVILTKMLSETRLYTQINGIDHSETNFELRDLRKLIKNFRLKVTAKKHGKNRN